MYAYSFDEGNKFNLNNNVQYIYDIIVIFIFLNKQTKIKQVNKQ